MRFEALLKWRPQAVQAWWRETWSQNSELSGGGVCQMVSVRDSWVLVGILRCPCGVDGEWKGT